jgi:hypothetical protein
LKIQINHTTLVQGTGLMVKWKEQTIEEDGLHISHYFLHHHTFFVFMNNNRVFLNIEALP